MNNKPSNRYISKDMLWLVTGAIRSILNADNSDVLPNYARLLKSYLNEYGSGYERGFIDRLYTQVSLMLFDKNDRREFIMDALHNDIGEWLHNIFEGNVMNYLKK